MQKVLEKCQLREAIREKEEGLDSFGKIEDDDCSPVSVGECF